MAEELAAHTSGAPLRGALLCGRGGCQDGLQHLLGRGLLKRSKSARLRHLLASAVTPPWCASPNDGRLRRGRARAPEPHLPWHRGLRMPPPLAAAPTRLEAAS